jgi:site-specific recombinase XerD
MNSPHTAAEITRVDALFSERRRYLSPTLESNYIVRVAGETAKLGSVWPHMLRHSCGHYLADRGTDLERCRTMMAWRVRWA